jgi:glutamate racemase
MSAQSIGIFDSGYGGLTVMKEIIKALPEYDYIYLGDNARAPYGSRSFESVHRYTWECVQWFFSMNCPLVILACNTASAKALRSIQQQDLPKTYPNKKVLGVIRPTTEIIGSMSRSDKVGILATKGTVLSDSYAIEIQKFFPETEVYQEACPMWVPLIENNEHHTPGADYFIKKHLDNLFNKEKGIDTVLLACTHYPLIETQIRQNLPDGVRLVSQGPIVAASLVDYLARHPEIESQISRNGQREFYTTDSTEDFDNQAAVFFGDRVKSKHLETLIKGFEKD